MKPTIIKMEVYAPEIAAKAQPGQYIVLKVDDFGESVPLAITDFNKSNGTITIIFQIDGAETFLLNQKNKGDTIPDFIGPLGKPFITAGLNNVAVIGGGAGCTIAYPVARQLHEQGATVHSIIGFRTKNLVMLEDEFGRISNSLMVMTDDGSYGKPGLVTDALNKLLVTGEFDGVIAIGPIVMMKYVTELTKRYGVKTTLSMNPIDEYISVTELRRVHIG